MCAAGRALAVAVQEDFREIGGFPAAGRILVLAGVNGAGKSSLLGTWLEAEGLSWFNPDSFTRRLVEAGWPLPEANAFCARMATLGLGRGMQAVCYDASGGPFAARLSNRCDKGQSRPPIQPVRMRAWQ